MKKKYLNLEFILSISFVGMSIGEATAETDNLFEAYKHLKCQEHFQNGLTPQDRRLMNSIGEVALAGAKYVNGQSGEFRFRTDLPDTKECFAREMDTNQPVTEELKAEVFGVDGSAATTSQPQAVTEAKNTAEAPGAADASGEGKKQRKKLPDEVVADIRRLLGLKAGEEGYMKQGEIAKKHGIDPSTVSDIKVGRGRYGKDQIQTAEQAKAAETTGTATVTPAAQAPAAPQENGQPQGF